MASTTPARQRIMLEYTALNSFRSCPTGVYVFPCEDDLFRWDGVLFVHRGFYSAAVLRFTINFPPSYPAAPPSFHFSTAIIHPLVSRSSGAVDLRMIWNEEGNVSKVLFWIKGIFKKFALDELREEECVDQEAYGWYRDKPSMFIRMAEQSAELTTQALALYNPVPSITPSSSSYSSSNLVRPKKDKESVIRFEKLDEETIERARKEVEVLARMKLMPALASRSDEF